LGWLWWFTPVIPATWEAEIRRLQFKASLGGKGSQTLSQPKSGMVGHICNPSYGMHRSEDHGIGPDPNKKWETLSEK
jgi:hypothetical protein